MQIVFYRQSLLPVLSFFVTFVYSFSLLRSKASLDNGITIGFILFCLYVFIWTYKYQEKVRHPLCYLISLATMIHSGLLLGYFASGAPVTELWVTDSFSMHVPNSINYANWLYGLEPIRETRSLFDSIYATNRVVGLFFLLFGVSPVSSGFALLAIKWIGIVAIFKTGETLFSKRTGFIAGAAYVLMPTILFYTTTYYKEVTVQALVALFYLGCSKIIKTGRFSFSSMALVFFSLALLVVERFYLFPALGLTFFLLLFVSPSIPTRLRLGTLCIGIVAALAFVLKYRGYLTPSHLLSTLEIQSQSYAAYQDVNPRYNSDLIYPLKLIKIIFTPYFTFNKFSVFFNYSYLLIWGSFFNQALILGTFAFFIKNISMKIRRFGPLLLGPALVLMVFAHMAPYNGRVRDSFYPLFCVLFAQYLNKRRMGKEQQND